MKAFWVQMNDLFSDILRDVAIATNFAKKMTNSALSSLWHSETEWNMYMHDLIAALMLLYSSTNAAISCKILV